MRTAADAARPPACEPEPSLRTDPKEGADANPTAAEAETEAMTRATRIYLLFLPLAAVATIFLGLTWYVPAALCAIGAVVALVASRRAVRTQFEDDAIRDNGLVDDDEPPGPHARDLRPDSTRR